MIVAIDTSSLLSLVRYYLPFDTNNVLFNLIKLKIENKEIIILDKVFDECSYTAKGIVIDKLEYLKLKKNQVNTTDLLPSSKFFRLVENNFINGSAKNVLSPVEFENRKNSFLESADVKLLLYSLENQSDGVIIVSEETETNNDNKAFKKLPWICKYLKLEIITLPELFEKYPEISLEFNNINLQLKFD
ncbi:DUF4411 family protein [Flagellimonas onchidii]|uniref:DUF4411 family protein n=1 Tax=Flagellimonas onchidii TaxID=2562684 RepID=UPI0010A654FF|nr:DUF4411 family protein [Allomuricauda onchidii]